MAETTRCAHLVSASISSPADVTFYTPNGNVNSATIPMAGINLVSRSYIDAVRASVSLVGYADTSAAQVANPVILNNTITTSDTVIGGVVLARGTRVLLTGDIGIAVGVYTVVGPGILSQTIAVSPGDAIFVQNTNQLYYCVVGRILLPWVAGQANVNVYPATPHLATVLANVAGTFILNSGVYHLPTLVVSQDRTTLIGYGARIIMGAPLEICADNVSIIGAAISGGIAATDCANLQLRDVFISGGASCIITGGTASIDNLHATGATGAGIRLVNIADGQLANSAAYNNTVGAAFVNAKNIVVTGCRLHDNDTGITLSGCDGIVISATLIYRNVTGVDASAAVNCLISGRIADNTTGVISTTASNMLGEPLYANTVALTGVAACGSLPPGSIQAYAGTSAPIGWLVCDGSLIAMAVYANLFAAIGGRFGSTAAEFRVPDLRNMFVRGFDARAAREFGSVEADSFKQHTHDIDGAGLAVSAISPQAPSINTYTNGSTELGIVLPITKMAAVGGTETRPINLNLTYIIKY